MNLATRDESKRMSIRDWISGKVFSYVHGNNLVYNACWEDPRLDRVALQLTEKDNVMVITSAGCNALDYVLNGPANVHAVDMNPRQNALLELKKSGIRNLEYEDFFQMFGNGYLPNVQSIYTDKLRRSLSPWAEKYWDRYIKFFDNPKRSFYFRGTSGSFARAINAYIDRIAHVRKDVSQLLAAKTVEEQQKIYPKVHDKIWTRTLQFAMKRDTTLTMLGVPKAQRAQIDRQYTGGIAQFVEDCMEAVFSKLPIHDNYFWRVYITGRYTPDCCPEYLKPENFQKLRGGLIDRVRVHTDSVQGFLEKHDGQISRFVLLDHMDWLSDRFFPLLESEWQAIIERAAPSARILWRSGGLRTDFINDVSVRVGGQTRKLPELLTFQEQLAADLHQKDRVHTYGSFYIADLAA
jgi:S-adenosylmethionine-diacylglycerol 3-amino-3-carboxypropyl transferase